MRTMRRLTWALLLGLGWAHVAEAATRRTPHADILAARQPGLRAGRRRVLCPLHAGPPGHRRAHHRALSDPGAVLLTDLKNDSLTRADLVRVQPSWVCSFADNLADVPDDVLTLSEAQNTFFAAPLAGPPAAAGSRACRSSTTSNTAASCVNMTKYQASSARARLRSGPTWDSFIGEAAG